MVLRLVYILISISATLLSLPKALAQNAVGLTVGGPTYIHFTRGLSGPTALEVGISFSYNHATHIYADYLLETHDPLKSPELKDMGLFYGVGGMMAVTNKDRVHKDGYYGDKDGDVGLGVRLPVGINWRPTKTQDFSFHLQIVPIVTIVPETELEFNAGLGLKFHF